jgi:hypothetical protein
MLIVVMLTVTFYVYHYAECRYANGRYAWY